MSSCVSRTHYYPNNQINFNFCKISICFYVLHRNCRFVSKDSAIFTRYLFFIHTGLWYTKVKKQNGKGKKWQRKINKELGHSGCSRRRGHYPDSCFHRFRFYTAKKMEKESNAASVSVDRIKLKDDSAQAQQMSNTETEVEIEFEDCAVPVGTQLKMTALVVPENTDQALIWSSSDSSVAEIDKDGILTVKAVGTTVVTATVGTVSDSVVIEGIENVAQGSKK